MGKTTKIFLVLAIIATLAFLSWGTVRIVKAVQFSMNCEQYIKRAADANTVELAKGELNKAILYAEENNLTSGIVSIFLHQPRNDVGYWYNNMCQALKELEQLPEDATSLEKSNLLMKLRESLTDQKESGVTVTIPNGISIFPYNVIYFWWGIISFILCVGFWVIAIISSEEFWD